MYYNANLSEQSMNYTSFDDKCVRVWIMRRMKRGGAHLIAFYFKHGMRRGTARMMFCCISLIPFHSIERLCQIGPPVFYVVDVAAYHRHDGLCGVQFAHMTVRALMQILHATRGCHPN